MLSRKRIVEGKTYGWHYKFDDGTWEQLSYTQVSNFHSWQYIPADESSFC